MHINISYGVTKDWLQYAQISIASILKNANIDDEYTFYIVCNNCDEEDKKLFEKLDIIKKATYNFLQIDDSLFKRNINNPRGVSTFYRVFLADMIPDLDKILYLDADTIIHSDIAELYRYDITDYYLAGVEDKTENIMRNFVKLEDGRFFINAGVLLMNLAKFREDNLKDDLYEHLKMTEFYCDQMTINQVCQAKILQLPLKFNIMIDPANFAEKLPMYVTRRDEYEEAAKNPVVHHLWAKPWEQGLLPTTIKWFELKEELEKL